MCHYKKKPKNTSIISGFIYYWCIEMHSRNLLLRSMLLFSSYMKWNSVAFVIQCMLPFLNINWKKKHKHLHTHTQTSDYEMTVFYAFSKFPLSACLSHIAMFVKGKSAGCPSGRFALWWATGILLCSPLVSISSSLSCQHHDHHCLLSVGCHCHLCFSHSLLI